MYDPLLHPTATEDFLAWGLASNRFHGETPNVYRACLARLQARFPGQTVSQVMTVPAVLEFLRVAPDGTVRRVGERGWSENTVDTHLRAFRSFSRYGARVGLCEDLRDPLTDAYKLKVRGRRKALWLSSNDIKTVLSACDDTALGRRDEALILAGVLTGLRRSELAVMQWNHIDFRAHTLWVPKGKGDKERYVGLLPRAADFLAEWKAQCARDLGAVPTTHPVLPTLRVLNGQPTTLWWDRPAKAWYQQRQPFTSPYWHMSGTNVDTRVRDCGRRVGIEGLGPHDLRRTFAGLLEEAGVPVQQISAQLGHANVDTTIRYLDSNPSRRADAMADVQVGF